MAQADNLNNTSSRWWSLAQTLVWISRRIEMLLREAEQIANSPEMNHKIEGALSELKREFWRAVLGMTEGMPIDKFRMLCGGRYVDLLTFIQLPSGMEPGALSAAMHELQRSIRWQDVECNSDWLKRAFPAPAPASVPVTNTESSVAEPEAASIDARTAAAESPSGPILTDAASAKPPKPDNDVLSESRRREICMSGSDRQSERRGNPVWDWPGLIKHLKEREQKLTFITKQDALEYYRCNVQRIDQTKAGDGPDVKSVRRACKKYDLDQYVTISRPST